MDSLLNKLLGRFVTVAAMDEVDSVTSVSFEDRANQLDDELMIGFITKQTFQQLEEVESREMRNFYTSIREFFVGAASYIAHKFN